VNRLLSEGADFRTRPPGELLWRHGVQDGQRVDALVGPFAEDVLAELLGEAVFPYGRGGQVDVAGGGEVPQGAATFHEGISSLSSLRYNASGARSAPLGQQITPRSSIPTCAK